MKSVANAIRTGILIERIYSGLSPSHGLAITDEITAQLEVGAGSAGEGGSLLVFFIFLKLLWDTGTGLKDQCICFRELTCGISTCSPTPG